MYRLIEKLNSDNKWYYRLLFESMHGSDDVYKISDIVINDFKNYVNDIKNGNIVFCDKFDDIINFGTAITLDDEVINIHITVNPYMDNFSVRGHSSDYDGYDINIYEHIKDDVPFYDDIKNVLIHELHHVYQHIKSKGTLKVFNRIEYSRILNASLDKTLPKYVSNFFYCLYLMDKREIDANVPLIYNELKSYKIEKKWVKQKMKAMPSWKKYNSVRIFMNNVLEYDKIVLEEIAKKYSDVFRTYYSPGDYNKIRYIAEKVIKESNKVLRKMAVNAKKYYDEIDE